MLEFNLREIRHSDFPFFKKWFSDPEVMKYLVNHIPDYTEEKWKEDLAIINKQGTTLFLIETIEYGHIGYCGFSKDGKLGITIGEKDLQGQGYGSAITRKLIEFGFEKLRLRRILSYVDENNIKSIKMHQRHGFKEIDRQKGVKIIFCLQKKDWNMHNLKTKK